MSLEAIAVESMPVQTKSPSKVLRRLSSVWLLPLAFAPCGCAVVSSAPSWELLKASGTATAFALAYAPSGAKNVVHHGDAPITEVCIEYNPTAQLPDLVPSLQAALRDQGVRSRVYEAGTGAKECGFWLRYVAAIEWDLPPLSSSYRAYLSSATLGLLKANGAVLASGSYEMDGTFGLGKWASTRRKVAPVVRALITGFET
jgi:hypothetical protein